MLLANVINSKFFFQFHFLSFMMLTLLHKDADLPFILFI